MSSTKGPSGVHLVGSFPTTFASSEDVFRLASSKLPDHLLRIPDGETGERFYFMGFQDQILKKTPLWQELWAGSPQDGFQGAGTRDLSDDEVAQALSEMDRPKDQGGLDLLYDSYAIASYERFAELKKQGVISKRTKFQVSLPTPVNVVCIHVRKGYQTKFEEVYERAMLRTLANIANKIPHEDLAIQWDMAIEFAMLDHAPGDFWKPWFSGDLPAEIEKRTLRLVDAVPRDVEVGLHLCYGDLGHVHFIEPKDTAMLVNIASRILKNTSADRNITWIHMPVPKGRNDEAYFAPLKELDLGTTRLGFGLVHANDEEGTRERIEQAEKVVGSFMIASECGFGRTPDEDFRSVLEICGKCSQPVQ